MGTPLLEGLSPGMGGKDISLVGGNIGCEAAGAGGNPISAEGAEGIPMSGVPGAGNDGWLASGPGGKEAGLSTGKAGALIEEGGKGRPESGAPGAGNGGAPSFVKGGGPAGDASGSAGGIPELSEGNPGKAGGADSVPGIGGKEEESFPIGAGGIPVPISPGKGGGAEPPGTELSGTGGNPAGGAPLSGTGGRLGLVADIPLSGKGGSVFVVVLSLGNGGKLEPVDGLSPGKGGKAGWPGAVGCPKAGGTGPFFFEATTILGALKYFIISGEIPMSLGSHRLTSSVTFLTNNRFVGVTVSLS